MSDLGPGEEETRWLFYTSGTTSDPKGARHSDLGLLAASTTYCDALRPSPDDRIAAFAPMAHVGRILHILCSLMAEVPLLIMDVFEPVSAARMLGENGVTIGGSGVPFGRMFLALQRTRPQEPLFPALKAFLVGGSSRPASIHYEVRDE